MATTLYINTMKKKTHILLLLCTAAITVGCDKNRTASEQLDRVQEKTADVAQDMKDFTFAQKEEFVTKMRAELAALNSELDELAAKVERSSSAVKADAQPRIDVLRERTAQLNQQLDEATNATESNWNKFKADIRATSDRAKEEFKQARLWLSEKIAP
jgi:small-conductance mechanosensitive channel